MPANIVKPGEEKYWQRAKKQAEKQGRGEDWAYVTGIFKRMVVNKAMAEESDLKKALPTRLSTAYPQIQRYAGQVPNKENIQLMRMMEKRAPRFTPAMMLNQDNAYLSVASVLDGLGLDRGQMNEWSKYIGEAIGAPNELTLRQDLLQKLLAEKFDPALRKAIFQRTLSLYKDTMKKSQVAVVQVDDLHKAMKEKPRFFIKDNLKKADPKGGTYYRRAMTKSGKYRYFYNEDQYKRSKGAHINGEDATKSAMKKCVMSRIEKSNGKGVKLGDLKDVVKRYGSQTVASMLQDECRSEGGLTFKNGCLKLRGNNK